MTRRDLLARALAAAAAGAAAGCGYSLAGRGSFLPAHIRVIGIPPFTNTTAFYEVGQVFTERVRTEFISRGKYKVQPDTVGVDAVLNGEILSLQIAPSSFSEDQQASRYVITVIAKIQFRDVTANRVIWENPRWAFREEYDAAAAVDALDPNAFFGQDATALDRVGTEFAKSVVSAILEAF
ncbi:MAG TPA: LptE family protein [Vicinamibacterales bacterium]